MKLINCAATQNAATKNWFVCLKHCFNINYWKRNPSGKSFVFERIQKNLPKVSVVFFKFSCSKKGLNGKSNTTVGTSISSSIFPIYSWKISLYLLVYFFLRSVVKTNLLIYFGRIEAAPEEQNSRQLSLGSVETFLCFVSDGKSIMCKIYGRVETSDTKK